LNPAGRGSELPMEYLWDLYSVRITIEMESSPDTD
jgi:hypothetical protein